MSLSLATIPKNTTPTTMIANMALPPMNANGSSCRGAASNRRQRNENVMMENMSLPTPRPI